MNGPDMMPDDPLTNVFMPYWRAGIAAEAAQIEPSVHRTWQVRFPELRPADERSRAGGNGGRNKYSTGEVMRLAIMRGLVDRGLSIAAAAGIGTIFLTGETTRELQQHRDPGRTFAEGITLISWGTRSSGDDNPESAVSIFTSHFGDPKALEKILFPGWQPTRSLENIGLLNVSVIEKRVHDVLQGHLTRVAKP